MPSTSRMPRWTSFAFALSVVATAGFVRADHDDFEDNQCRDFAGPFTSEAVPVPPCASPIGLCTHGTLGPNFPGSYDATFLSMVPAGDPNDPTKFLYTGVSTITPGKGQTLGKFGVMTSVDTGVIHITGNGVTNPFVTTAAVNAGTKKFKHVTGLFVASGNIDFTTGQAAGGYTAHLCKGDDEHHHGHDHDDDDD